MYRKIEDFTRDWAIESEMTLKVLRSIPQKAADTRIDPEGRSLGHLAWHLAESLAWLQMSGMSLGIPADGTPEKNMTTIANLYERWSAAILEHLPTQWSDAELEEEVELFGQRWTRGGVLRSLITHQAHHRGQMTVLMRQAGLRVPGIYGPSREEWAEMGMSAPVLE